MFRVMQVSPPRRIAGFAGLLAAAFLSACSSGFNPGDLFSSGPGQQPLAPPQQPAAIGNGQIRVGLILPLSAGGNAGVAAISMKNAAEMALAEFNSPNVQL